MGFGFIFLAIGSIAQEETQIKARRQKLYDEIAYTKHLLAQCDQDTKISLAKIEIVERQMKARDEIIETINDEIYVYNIKIRDKQENIEELETEITNLKNDYAQLIRFAWRHRSGYSRVMYILAAEDLGQSYKRIRYLNEYAEHRKRQAQTLKKKQEVLVISLKELETVILEKEDLKSAQVSAADSLSNTRRQYSEIVEKYKQKHIALDDELLAMQNTANLLNTEIDDEISARQPTELLNTATDEFVKAKGKMPWPVSNGLITKRFGKFLHPVISGIYTFNNGIEISTDSLSVVNAVFGGTVSRVINISEGSLAVLLRHGDYFTVYSNLSSVYVQGGQAVANGGQVGKISNNGVGILEFQVWYKNTKLNPEKWIIKK